MSLANHLFTILRIHLYELFNVSVANVNAVMSYI